MADCFAAHTVWKWSKDRWFELVGFWNTAYDRRMQRKYGYYWDLEARKYEIDKELMRLSLDAGRIETEGAEDDR